VTQSAQTAATEILAAEDLGGRWIDMAIDVRNWGRDPAAKRPDYSSSKSLLSVGGVWDRRLGTWDDERTPKRYLTWHVHAGQEPAIDFFGRWLDSYIAGDRMVGFEDVYSMMCVGGRRGGKSDAAAKCAALFGLAVPESIVWLIAPALRKTEELRRIFRAIPADATPGAWGRWSAAPLLRTLPSLHPGMGRELAAALRWWHVVLTTVVAVGISAATWPCTVSTSCSSVKGFSRKTDPAMRDRLSVTASSA